MAVTGGARYKLTAFIKLLDLQNGSLYQNVDMLMMCLDEHGKNNLKTQFGLHNSLMTLSRVEIRNPW